MKKVSFDYDATMDIGRIRDYAKSLNAMVGVEVWVVTSRLGDDESPNENWNDDLKEDCYFCGIPLSRVIFTPNDDKWKVLDGFVFHLDDDWSEIRMINDNLDGVVGITSFGNKNWKKDCNKALRDFKDV